MKIERLWDLLGATKSPGKIYIMSLEGEPYQINEAQTVEFVEQDDGVIDVVLSTQSPFPKLQLSQKVLRDM